MPYLHADPSLDDTPTNPLARNAFLIFRLVFLGEDILAQFAKLVPTFNNIQPSFALSLFCPSSLPLGMSTL